MVQLPIFWLSVQFSSVTQLSSDSLQTHESQHARPPCPSPTPGVHSDSRPSSQWCHPAISSSGVPFSSCPQSLPASASFPMSQLFAWGGQSTGVSALASFLPKKSQGWSPSEWTGWISLQTNTNSVEIVFGILLLSLASNMQYETPSWCWTEAGSHISQSDIWSPGETTHSFTTILVFHFQYIV